MIIYKNNKLYLINILEFIFRIQSHDNNIDLIYSMLLFMVLGKYIGRFMDCHISLR
jgi:hypothetical protein